MSIDLRNTPRFIAICGAPGSGKSSVQNFMTELGIVPIDDAQPLRRAVMALYGLTWWHVSTAAGKRQQVKVCGTEYTVRDLLGTLGEQLEKRHGTQFLAEQAVRVAVYGGSGKVFSFGSVRRDQGAYYKQRGGVVLEVRMPLNEETRYAFDEHSKADVDYSLLNTGSLADLRKKTHEFVHRISTGIT